MSVPPDKLDKARGDPRRLAALVKDSELREALLACLPQGEPAPRKTERVSAALAYVDEMHARGMRVGDALEAAANRFGYSDPETLRKARQRRRAAES